MSEYVKGSIATFAETKCPICQGSVPGTAIAVERVWDGERWVLLNSLDGARVMDEAAALKPTLKEI
jgi:hypothetical protein